LAGTALAVCEEMVVLVHAEVTMQLGAGSFAGSCSGWPFSRYSFSELVVGVVGVFLVPLAGSLQTELALLAGHGDLLAASLLLSLSSFLILAGFLLHISLFKRRIECSANMFFSRKIL
jgi:hypothetical protein